MANIDRLYERHEATRVALEKAKRQGQPAPVIERLRQADREAVDAIAEANRQARKLLK